MLVLERKVTEEIFIGRDIMIKVCKIYKREGIFKVKIGIAAPKDIIIERGDFRKTDKNVTAFPRKNRKKPHSRFDT